MAEVAAGAVIYEAASTTAQVGATTYALGKPTNGLKANFQQFGTASADRTSASLARSNHSLTVVGQRAYVFGGLTNENKLTSNDIHSFALATPENAESDYHLVPAVPLGDGGRLPEPRMDHSACAFNGGIAVYGGCDASGILIDDPSIWLFDPKQSVWHPLTATGNGPPPRSGAKLFSNRDTLVLYGGRGTGRSLLSDVWRFEPTTASWIELPEAPISTSNAAMAEGSLYLISGTDALSSNFHFLNTNNTTQLLWASDEASNTPPESPEDLSWETIPFPTNALAPGPRPRENGGLLHIPAGYGRNYLLYFFGERKSSMGPAATTAAEQASGLTHWSDMWTFQLPSSDLTVKPALSIAEAIQPAKIKDMIRGKVSDSGTYSWAEVELQPPGDIQSNAGKVHPGPRSSFGYDVLADGRSVVIWGGTNAKGEREGDGWIVELE